MISEGPEQKLKKKCSKTSISDWDMDVQGPGFEQVLATFWGPFLKNVAKTSRSDKVLSAGGGWGEIGESGLAWGELTQGGLLSKTTLGMTWTGKNVNTHTRWCWKGPEA